MFRPLATLIVSIACAAQVAAAPLISFSSYSTFGGDGPWSLGFQFTTGATSSLVSALGAFDFQGNGFLDSHEVGIWTLGGTLLASVTVNSSDVFEALGSSGDGFRYAAIAPLVLDANTSYVIGASDFGVNDRYVLNTFDSVMAAGFTYNEARYFQGPGLVIPDGTDADYTGYFGANLQVSALDAPELNSAAATLPLTFLGIGLALVGSGRKRAPQA